MKKRTVDSAGNGPRPNASMEGPGSVRTLFARLLLLPLLYLALLVQPSGTQARTSPSPALRIDYAVKIADLNQKLLHVTAGIKNIDQPVLELSLPTWTPGWYTIEDYAKNFLRFTAKLPTGQPVAWVKHFKQTWRFDTRGVKELLVEFDYRANALELNQCEITSQHAFLNGTALFHYAEGHLNSPSTVRIQRPEGWEIATGLEPGPESESFTADSYHTLVDSPTLIGLFDRERFEAQGAEHEVVFDPKGSVTPEARANFAQQIKRVVDAESAMFGGVPYKHYLCFYFFSTASGTASGALEHANSHVAIVGPRAADTPATLSGLAAHEFFHVWNVKRIRPAEMWPYNYIHEPYTPSLWVSEGFTDYYADVALRRAGLREVVGFLRAQSGAITVLEQNEARHFVSAAQASIDTWLGYDTPQAFTISYYNKGQLLAMLLDLSILNDTGGSAGLDEVMRALFTEFYRRDRGFTPEDLVRLINRISGRDYREFFRRYVNGTDDLPYDRCLGYAGYRLEWNEGSASLVSRQSTISSVAAPSPWQLRIRRSWLR